MHSLHSADSAVRAGPAQGRSARGGEFLPAPLGDAVLRAERYIIRLDGLILGNGIARAGLAPWLKAIAGRFVLVSSNSRDTGRTMATKLRRAGLDVPEQRIVLAGEEALRFAAAQYPGARCKVLASRVLAHAARSHGLELVQDSAEVILLGRDSAWTYRDLALVVHELARGAQLVVSNDDLTCIGHGGRPIPDTGAILASIVAAAGETSAITRFSRAATLRAAQARLAAGDGEALVISNQDADLAAAQTIAGLRCVWFEPGADEGLAGFAEPGDRRSGIATDLYRQPGSTEAALR